MRGRFITFEGGEGTGKSTQASLLVRRLKTLALTVVLTREPGGSAGAEVIRYVLLSGAAKPLGAEIETILFAAARDDHVRTMIVPALERGKWVVCDRFIDSTRVYQGAVGDVDPRIIRSLERVTIADAMPDLTFVLDLPADIGLERAAARRGGTNADRFEQETLAFHKKLRDAYRDIAAQEPSRCVLIDAQRPQSAVADEIWAIVSDRLDPATAPLALEDAPQ
jgi:dTMP kinase